MSASLLRTGLWVAACVTLLSGCAGLSRDARIGVATAVTAVAGHTPSNDLVQTYYLGVFDPQDQLNATLYRVRVAGQASALNATRFASGWVKADLVDSLSSVARFDAKDPGTPIVSGTGEKLATGRRLMMFGPEGFREAPADHRLVIAMGSSPETFFTAVDQTLGILAQATQGQGGQRLSRGLFRESMRLRLEREQLEAVRQDAADAARQGAAQ